MGDLNTESAVKFLNSLPYLKGHQADPTFSRWQLDPQDVLDYIEHTLRGERWSASTDGQGGGWTKVAGVAPLMNETGIQAILRDLTGVVNRVVIMSNLTEEACNEILHDKACELAWVMMRRYWPSNDWGMLRKDFDSVYRLIMNFFEASINRARLDGERRKLYETQKQTETHVIDNSERKRGGILSLIPGLGGR